MRNCLKAALPQLNNNLVYDNLIALPFNQNIEQRCGKTACGNYYL